MKHIRKGKTPAALERFVRDNAATPQLLAYRNLSADVRLALMARMLKEQGYLCAYTMRRVGGSDLADYHIEHLKPQALHPESQLDYNNMLLCAPGVEKPDCGWGARCKGDFDPVDANFVSPLRSDCESRLRYGVGGEVSAADPLDAAARTTVEVLKLNHRELVAERLRALHAFGVSRNARRPIGAREAEQLSRNIRIANAAGEFEPFCIAISQVSRWLATKAALRSARTRSAR